MAWDVSAAAGAGEEARSGGWNALETRPIAIRSLRVIPRPRLHDAVTLRNSLQLLTLCAVADVSAETLLCAEHTVAELRTFLHHCQLWETRSSFRPHSLLYCM